MDQDDRKQDPTHGRRLDAPEDTSLRGEGVAVSGCE